MTTERPLRINKNRKSRFAKWVQRIQTGKPRGAPFGPLPVMPATGGYAECQCWQPCEPDRNGDDHDEPDDMPAS